MLCLAILKYLNLYKSILVRVSLQRRFFRVWVLIGRTPHNNIYIFIYIYVVKRTKKKNKIKEKEQKKKISRQCCVVWRVTCSPFIIIDIRKIEYNKGNKEKKKENGWYAWLRGGAVKGSGAGASWDKNQDDYKLQPLLNNVKQWLQTS